MLDAQNISAPLKAQLTRARISRAKVFGFGRPRPMCREAKAKLAVYLRARRASRALSRAHFDVAEKLLFKFHNAASGRCFPSYKALAAEAGCAVSTAQKAVESLERLGVLSWVHRLKREVVDGVVRVLRSSNGYAFSLPAESAAFASFFAGGLSGAKAGLSALASASGGPGGAQATPEKAAGSALSGGKAGSSAFPSSVDAALARLAAARAAREAR